MNKEEMIHIVNEFKTNYNNFKISNIENKPDLLRKNSELSFTIENELINILDVKPISFFISNVFEDKIEFILSEPLDDTKLKINYKDNLNNRCLDYENIEICSVKITKNSIDSLLCLKIK